MTHPFDEAARAERLNSVSARRGLVENSRIVTARAAELQDSPLSRIDYRSIVELVLSEVDLGRQLLHPQRNATREAPASPESDIEWQSATARRGDCGNRLTSSLVTI